MLGLYVPSRILLFTGATDMRKGIDGLSALVTAAGEDPYSGHLYVFVSRRRDRAKILAFQKGGMVLWLKRLDCGRFQIHLPDAGERAELDATQLAMLADGIDFGRVKRPRHWQPKRD
ncbi:MAG TPA: IS66 family insertion sequence element accessory protein TnpB [Vicinamibacterales bacterium]|jgi:transposase|nr:IS66 family insertion sequence element accessory protein TnpB [Vicinamibacterales bacterium]